jgi:hypothetical protein
VRGTPGGTKVEQWWQQNVDLAPYNDTKTDQKTKFFGPQNSE